MQAFADPPYRLTIKIVDAATTVPEFGGWACYDHQAKRWLSPDRIKLLVAVWFEQHGADYSGTTLDDPSVMESFAHSGDRAHGEFMQVPRVVPPGVTLKNDLNRIDQILDASWERHRQRVLKYGRFPKSA